MIAENPYSAWSGAGSMSYAGHQDRAGDRLDERRRLGDADRRSTAASRAAPAGSGRRAPTAPATALVTMSTMATVWCQSWVALASTVPQRIRVSASWPPLTRTMPVGGRLDDGHRRVVEAADHEPVVAECRRR